MYQIILSYITFFLIIVIKLKTLPFLYQSILSSIKIIIKIKLIKGVKLILKTRKLCYFIR